MSVPWKCHHKKEKLCTSFIYYPNHFKFNTAFIFFLLSSRLTWCMVGVWLWGRSGRWVRLQRGENSRRVLEDCSEDPCKKIYEVKSSLGNWDLKQATEVPLFLSFWGNILELQEPELLLFVSTLKEWRPDWGSWTRRTRYRLTLRSRHCQKRRCLVRSPLLRHLRTRRTLTTPRMTRKWSKTLASVQNRAQCTKAQQPT